jgi:hypothetical protein
MLLEAMLESNQLPVPPQGVCDQWGVSPDDVAHVGVDTDQLAQIHPSDVDAKE